MFAGRDQVNPQAGRDCATDLYGQAGITNPRKDFDMAEVYVPFSWYEPMWMENLGFCDEGDGWKMTESGATSMVEGGDMPINCSGGVLSSNPIGASGMMRFAEAARRCGGSRASTRSTAPGGRWATPTGVARSTSRCGWSVPRSRSRPGGAGDGRYARRNY